MFSHSQGFQVPFVFSIVQWATIHSQLWAKNGQQTSKQTYKCPVLVPQAKMEVIRQLVCMSIEWMFDDSVNPRYQHERNCKKVLPSTEILHERTRQTHWTQMQKFELASHWGPHLIPSNPRHWFMLPTDRAFRSIRVTICASRKGRGVPWLLWLNTRAGAGIQVKWTGLTDCWVHAPG